MKKFIYKYFLREKPLPSSTNEKIVIVTSLFIILQIVIYANIQREFNELYEWRDNNVADTCRVKYMIYDYESNTNSYACKLKSNGDIIMIHESESPKLRYNGYINRPVKIYKNGTID